MLKAILGLPATVWLLSLVSLFNDSASELLYPLAPLYLAAVLMAGPMAGKPSGGGDGVGFGVG